ncbi:hypothetical protein M422DRAFT_245070 [Sphaerobolus stellatus SS14]|nr:hypothetical protein M422DRAFT_245070 [Sphaerobolus stellatus SS14]
MFAIDPKDPAKISLVGAPVSSGGDFPVSLTISKKTGQVCVLNGGRLNGVTCFKQDKSLGLLEIDNTQRSLNVNQTSAPNGPAGTMSHVIFSEDDTKLIASVKGVPPQPGFLASWDVDATTGVLSQDFVKSTPSKGGLLPFGMAIIPGKNAVLATDAGVGFDIFDFSKQSGNNPASSQIFPVGGQKAVCWAAFSPKTNDFFMTDIDTGIITEVNVDNNLNATIIKQYPQGNGTNPIDLEVATVGNNDFLYTMAAGRQSVLVHALPAPGKANLIQELEFANAAKNAGLTTSVNNLQGMTAFIGQ